MDYSPPGSFVRGTSQARTLEWVTISFSRDLPDPGIEPRTPYCKWSPALQVDSSPTEPPGKPKKCLTKYKNIFVEIKIKKAYDKHLIKEILKKRSFRDKQNDSRRNI